MIPELIDFASYDEIRAVLGVSDDELEDGTLALPMWLTMLRLELGDISEQLEDRYMFTRAQSTPTPQEQKLLDVVSVFSAYAIAKHLLTSLPLFAPKRITDGRAEVDRVADPFESVRQGVNSNYDTLRGRLNLLLEIAKPTANIRTYFTAVGLAVNPITNLR